MTKSGASYGGEWTAEKLDILEKYLDAYTTALKNQQFKMMYIDAFAGTGRTRFSSKEDLVDVQGFVSGSAKRAAIIDDKPFDKLIFVEKEEGRSAITRMLPISQTPDEISVEWAERLTRIFGDESWRNLYQETPQRNLFGDVEYQRDPGVDGLIRVYKERLKTLFRRRLLERSRTLKNSRNSPLFEFMFCVGNPNGINPAKKIANHILKHI